MNITEQIQPHLIYRQTHNPPIDIGPLVGVFTPGHFHMTKQYALHVSQTVPRIITTRHCPEITCHAYFCFPPYEKFCKSHHVTLFLRREESVVILDIENVKYHIDVSYSPPPVVNRILSVNLPSTIYGNISCSLLKDVANEIGVCSSIVHLFFYKNHCGIRFEAEGPIGKEVIEPITTHPGEITGHIELYSRDFVYLCHCLKGCTYTTVSLHGPNLISVFSKGFYVLAHCRQTPSYVTSNSL